MTLAEQLHFGRAANQLFVTQQALSKQIATLESEVGVLLVQRTTRAVELTPAGLLFLESCRRALRELDTGVEAVREDPGIVRLGLIVLGALELTDPILAEFRESRPGSEIVTRQFTFADPSAGMTDGSSDIAIVRLPIEGAGLRRLRLFVEPRVVAVPRDHSLASRDSVGVGELIDARITVSTASDQRYRRFWTLDEYRTAPMPTPIVTRSHAEEMTVVASGRAFSITSACSARMTPHSGVSFVPIGDIPGTECAIVWRADERSPLINEFVEGARRVLDRESELLRAIEHPGL